MDKLVFFICCLRGLGPRVIALPNRTNTLTSIHPFLAAQAYRCKDYEEFRWVSQSVGKKDTFYTEVLIESPSGKFRFPTDADTFPSQEEPPSPAAAAVAPPEDAGMVVPSAPAAAGDSIPDRMRKALKKDPKLKVKALAALLKEGEDALRAFIGKTGQPFKLRPYGFIGVVAQPTSPLVTLLD